MRLPGDRIAPWPRVGFALEMRPGTPILPGRRFRNVDYRCISGLLKRNCIHCHAVYDCHTSAWHSVKPGQWLSARLLGPGVKQVFKGQQQGYYDCGQGRHTRPLVVIWSSLPCSYNLSSFCTKSRYPAKRNERLRPHGRTSHYAEGERTMNLHTIISRKHWLTLITVMVIAALLLTTGVLFAANQTPRPDAIALQGPPAPEQGRIFAQPDDVQEDFELPAGREGTTHVSQYGLPPEQVGGKRPRARGARPHQTRRSRPIG